MPERFVKWVRELRLERFRKIAGFAAVLLSLLYIYIRIRSNLSGLSLSDSKFSATGVVILMLGIILTLMLSAFYHVMTVRRLERTCVSPVSIALAYSLGQIVRYIPGKVAGVVFQIGYLSGKLKASTVTIAIISQTIYDNLWTTIFAGSIILYALGDRVLSLIALCATLSIFLLSHRKAWVEKALIRPRAFRRAIGADQIDFVRRNHTCALPTATLAIVWLPFILGVVFFLKSMVTVDRVVLLCACYLLATVGSMLVFVVPSGIVVREALFMMIGLHVGFDAALLGFSGVAIRIALTTGEVVTAAILYVFDLLRNGSCSSEPDDPKKMG